MPERYHLHHCGGVYEVVVAVVVDKVVVDESQHFSLLRQRKVGKAEQLIIFVISVFAVTLYKFLDETLVIGSKFFIEISLRSLCINYMFRVWQVRQIIRCFWECRPG